MRIVLKLALRVADRARARAGSELRKFVLRATYPGLTIDSSATRSAAGAHAEGSPCSPGGARTAERRR